MSAEFVLQGVTWNAGGREILRGITLNLPDRGLIAIAGPNGAGKSSLLGVIAGLRQAYGGVCRYQGLELRQWDRRRFARQVAFLPQALRLEFPFTAEQVVLMGRGPFVEGFFENADDWRAVDSALRCTGCDGFRGRLFHQLSGGEQQRVLLATALAQEPRVLLLDEPTTYLDPAHQIEIFRLLREFADGGKLALLASHDLNLAAAYSDRLILLADGGIVADGLPADVLTPGRLDVVFGIHAEIHHGHRGNPWIVYDR